MKETCLAVDIGNTSLHFGFFQKNQLVESRKLAVNNLENLEEWWKKLAPPFQPNYVFFASVNPRITENFKAKMATLFHIPLFHIGKDVQIPMNMDVKAPKEVGVDRLINGWRAKEKYGAPVLVVDFGTAITIDVVSPEGVYLGGIIAPGLKLSAKALYEGTALLPHIQVSRQPEIIGKNTVEAMESGIFWGAVGMVEIWIQKVLDFQKWKDCRVVATGGDAKLLAPQCSSISVVDSDLTLEGIFFMGKGYL